MIHRPLQRIYLIGMPGSGKTTLGKLLAPELQLPFVDLDDQIERTEGRRISEIFEQNGEDFFRKLEAEILRGISSRDRFLCATGGGTPCFFENIQFMNSRGLTVFLAASIEQLVHRPLDHRPLLRDKDPRATLLALQSQRLPYYLQADLTLENDWQVGDLVRNLRAMMA